MQETFTPPVPFETAVTLVGGAGVAADDLAAACALAPVLVAADGGADHLAGVGKVPDLIVGDMDSLRGTPPPGTHMRRVVEQDSTDFEKCLRQTQAPLYIGVGFVGGRIDHTLAAMHVLIAHAARPVILLGPEDLCFAAPPDWGMEMTAGSRVSIYPVLPCKATRSTGLRWPVDGMEFRAGTWIGTSNAAEGGRVALSFAAPGAVIAVEKHWLTDVVASLSG